MRPRPRPVVSGMSLALTLLVMAVSSAPATAQDARLSTRTLSSDSLTAEQVGDIDKWVNTQTGILSKGATPGAIADARRAILEPLNNTLTKPVPRNEIVKRVAEQLPAAMKSDSLAVRMNALIVASEIPDAKVAPMVVAGLEDASPAVRYWAAKACAQIMSQRPGGEIPFPEADQQNILNAINAAAPKEGSDSVLDQMFQALASLTIQPARTALFEILKQRVAVHAKDVNLGLRADVAAIEKLQEQIVRDAVTGKAIGPALRDLTAVTAQFLQVAVNAIATGDADPTLQPVLERTVSVAQKVFDLAINQLAPDWDRRPPLEGVKTNAAELQLNASEWVGTPGQPGILTSSPVGIPADKLKLPGKKAPAPDPEGDAPKPSAAA